MKYGDLFIIFAFFYSTSYTCCHCNVTAFINRIKGPMHMIRQRHKVILILLLVASHQFSLRAAEEKELIMCFKDGRQEALTGALRQNVIGSSRTVLDLLEDKTAIESQTALPILLPIMSATFNKSVRPLLTALHRGPNISNKARKKIAAASANDLRELIKVNAILQFPAVSEEIARSFLSKERVAQFIKQPAAFARDIASFGHELDVLYNLVQHVTKSCSFALAAPRTLPIYTDHLVLSPDGTKLVGQTGDHMTTVFDIKENIIGPVYEIDTTFFPMWNTSGTHFAFPKNNPREITIFDASQVQQPKNHEVPLYCFVHLWNGTDIAVCNFLNSEIELLDVAKEKPSRRLYDPLPGYVEDAFNVSWNHSNSKIAGLDHYGNMRIHDSENGAQIVCGRFPALAVQVNNWLYRLDDPANDKKHDYTCLKWSPDDSQIAYYCRPRRTMYIWDTASGRLLHTLKTGERVLSMQERYWRFGLPELVVHHDRAICSLAWSPCGTMLVTSASDNALLIWDATNGRVIDTITLPADDRRTFVSVDWGANNMLVVATNDQLVHAFDMNNVEKLSAIMKSKISIPQVMLLAHILRYDTAFGPNWLNRLKKEDQVVATSSSKSKPKQSQEEKNEEHLLSLLYSLPTELKDSLKDWLATGFVIQRAQE